VAVFCGGNPPSKIIVFIGADVESAYQSESGLASSIDTPASLNL
jgi:hypothetical protein